MALRTRESARRHLVSRPCLPYPELVDLRAAFGVECEVAGSAGEQVGGGGVGEWHPCGLVDGEAIGAGPDVLCSRRIGGLDCFGLGDEAVELGVAESAAVGGAGRVLGVVVRAGQEVAEELARGGVVGVPVPDTDVPLAVRVREAPVELGVVADQSRVIADAAQGGDECAGRRGGDGVVVGADEVDGCSGSTRERVPSSALTTHTAPAPAATGPAPAPTPDPPMLSFTSVSVSSSTMSRASGRERASRSSLVTTRVSPTRQAASASRSPGRARFVPV